MATLSQLDAKTLVDLRPSELGGYLLEVLTGPNFPPSQGMVHLGNYVNRIDGEDDDRDRRELQLELANSISAAWNWLKVNGLLLRHGHTTVSVSSLPMATRSFATTLVGTGGGMAMATVAVALHGP